MASSVYIERSGLLGEHTLASPFRTTNVTERTNLVLLQLSIAAAVLLSLLAAFHSRFPADLTIARWIQAPAPNQGDGAAWLDTFMESVSALAGFPFAAVSVAIVGTALLSARRWRAGLIVLMVLIPQGVVLLAKFAIDRPRPSGDLVRILDLSSSGSFPSGHAFHAILFLGLLLALTAAGVQNRWLRRGLMFLLTSLLILIGLSRIYLGAHWPNDVLGSIFFSVATLILLLRVYQRLGGQWPAVKEADFR